MLWPGPTPDADQLQKGMELDPDHPLLRHNTGELLLARGRFEEAVVHLKMSAEVSPSSHYLAMLGCAYARAKRGQDAVRILNEIERRSKEDLASAFDMASMHVALGDRERAIAWLQKGYEDRDAWMVQIKAWPWFDSLLTDSRYQDLLQRMSFPSR